MKQTILFFAPVKTRSGYGDHARDLAYSIIEGLSDKFNLEILATNWGNTPWTGLDLSTEKGRAISNHIVQQPSAEQPAIFIQLTIPNEFQPVGKYNIGITAGIETDLCAPDWIEGCNRMDMLITTSTHSLEVFKQSKFDAHENGTERFVKTLQLRPELRTEVLFEGLDLNVYTQENVAQESDIYQRLSEIKEDFCYLFVGHWLEGAVGEDRKDVGKLLYTFAEAFASTPASTRPALVIKTSLGTSGFADRLVVEQRVQQILSTFKDPPSIYLLHGDLTDREMNTVYFHPKIKAMVSFTKGEGFGRPLLEFGATGKPIIASNWSGHKDFLAATSTLLLPGNVTPVHQSAVNKWILKEANWYTVDYAYARQTLKSVRKYYPSFLKLCMPQKNHVRQNFSFEAMTKKLKEIIDTVPVAVELTLPKADSSAMFQLPKLTKI